MARDYYCKLRYSLTKSFDSMTDEDVAALTRATLHYSQDLPLPPINGLQAKTLWPIIEDDLLRDKLDRENGGKGGRPPKNPNTDDPVYPVADKKSPVDKTMQFFAVQHGFSETEANEIARFVGEYSRDVVKESILACVEKGKIDMGYFRGVLKNKIKGDNPD